MKKSISIAVIAGMPFVVHAQGRGPIIMDRETFNVCATIFLIGLCMVFILAILKRIMENRLKNKIVDKGIPENVVSSILKINPKEDRNSNIKWCSLLIGLGAAFTLINYTLPLGIHSLAIMCFCIAAGFLGYYFFLRQSEK